MKNYYRSINFNDVISAFHGERDEPIRIEFKRDDECQDMKYWSA